MSTPRRPDAEVEAARRAVHVTVTPAEPYSSDEGPSFDIDVGGMGLIGRWTQTGEGTGIVVWTDGTHATTKGAAEPDAIEAAVRPSIPIRVEFDHRLTGGPTGPRRLPGLSPKR